MGTVPKKKSPAGTIVFLVLLAAVVIGGYLMITRNKDKGTKEIPAESSEADNLIKKDLFFDYPATPREVLKFFCRITKCLYNDDLSEEQMKKLVSQARGLYSLELLDSNDEKEQLARIKGDAEEYKKQKKEIYSYTLESASELESINTKAGKTTIIKMYFTVKAGSAMKKLFEEFSLVEDSNGRWKIAAFRTLPDAVDFN